MTQIDFPIVRDLYSDCIQNVFVSYLIWRKLEHRRIYESNWSFSITGENVFDIDTYRDGFKQLFDSLYRNYGLEVITIENPEVEDVINVLHKKEPAIVELDTFYCSWHRSFLKAHSSHYVAIVGIEKDKFLCVDSYVSSKIERIRMKELHMFLGKLLYIEYKHSNYQDWRKGIRYEIAQIMGKENDRASDFKQIRKFADRVVSKGYLLIDEVQKYESIAFFPLLLRLNNIGYGRKNFSNYLKFLSERNDVIEMNVIAERLEVQAMEWGRCSSMFIKYILSGRLEFIGARIYEKLYQIANNEENLVEELSLLLL